MNFSTEQMEKATQALMQACEEMSVLTRQQTDATLKAMTAAFQGYTEINQNIASLIQVSLTRAMSAGKTMMTAKSMREMMDSHDDRHRQNFRNFGARNKGNH